MWRISGKIKIEFAGIFRNKLCTLPFNNLVAFKAGVVKQQVNKIIAFSKLYQVLPTDKSQPFP